MKYKIFFLGTFFGVFLSILLVTIIRYLLIQSAEPKKLIAPKIDSKTIYSKSVDQIDFIDARTGSKVRLPKNKFLFINKWATWCSSCVAELPSIEGLASHFKGSEQIDFFLISIQRPDDIKRFLKKHPITLPMYLYVNNDELPIDLADNGYPHTYIVYNNQIVYKESGARKWNDPIIIDFIEKMLDKKLNEK